jgi:hypothetical protein
MKDEGFSVGLQDRIAALADEVRPDRVAEAIVVHYEERGSMKS